MIKAPCKDCTDRKELCHMTCEKYGIYKVETIKEKEMKKQKKAKENIVTNFKVERIQEWKRIKRMQKGK